MQNGYLKKGPVLWAAGAGAVTAAAAAFLATRIDAGLLRKCFGVYLLVMGGVELFGKKRETSK